VLLPLRATLILSSASAHESSDWITNRINRLRNLPLDSTQMSEIAPPSVPRRRGTPEDRDKWIKFLNGTTSIERSFSSARATSSSTLESHVRENPASSASASSGKDMSPDPRLHPYNDAGNLDPRFILTDDIHEEIMPERLLLGHFKFLFENGKFNSTDDVKAAYARLLGEVTLDLSHDFIYEITLNLFRSSDPFGFIARDFAVKQMDMLEEEKQLYRENGKLLHKQLKEKCDKDLAEVSKSMQGICAAKDKELRELKAAHRQTSIALTALEAKHTMLTIKSTAQNGADG
jgi:hypothetical protein